MVCHICFSIGAVCWFYFTRMFTMPKPFLSNRIKRNKMKRRQRSMCMYTKPTEIYMKYAIGIGSMLESRSFLTGKCDQWPSLQCATETNSNENENYFKNKTKLKYSECRWREIVADTSDSLSFLGENIFDNRQTHTHRLCEGKAIKKCEDVEKESRKLTVSERYWTKPF